MPCLTENEMKAAFLRMVNGLDRGSLLADLSELKSTYNTTAGMKPLFREQGGCITVNADAVMALIAQNTRVAQDQEKCSM